MRFPGSIRRAASVLVVFVALVACSGDSGAQSNATQQGAQRQQPAEVPTVPVNGPIARALPDFVPLVEKNGPAVVNVEVVGEAQTAGGPPGLSPDDPFYDFFRRFGVPGPFQGPPGGGQQPPPRGAGSGFIVSPDGYILTNAHVVEQAAQVTVRLTDRREFQAKVVGTDPRTDVAVLKIEAKDLPTVRIGRPEQLRPGEWVLAIGSPFGFENSATAGIVSATARAVPGDPASYVPFIQTDVAVNPGNSGGPLFNLSGEVVGINSMIFSRTGGYMGVSFAIPIDVAMDVREQLIKTGRVVRGRIGVTIQDVNAQLAQSFGLDRPRGALVSSVEVGSPAEKAGLQAGDVIIAVNGQSIERSTEVPGMIARMKPGSEAKLTVWRAGKQRDLTVRIAEFEEPEQRMAGGPAGRGGATDEAARLGLALRTLSPQEKQQIETQGNLVVEQVSGPAAAAGILPGDIILGVNGTRVKSVQELQAAAKKSGQTVALLIQREGAQIFVPVRVG